MPLSKEDILNIEKLGYKREEFVEMRNGIPRLKNVNGHCVFLDVSTGKCTIYTTRPTGCKLYPLIFVKGIGVQLDPLCPKSEYINRELVSRLIPRLIEFLRKLEKEYNVKVL